MSLLRTGRLHAEQPLVQIRPTQPFRKIERPESRIPAFFLRPLMEFSLTHNLATSAFIGSNVTTRRHYFRLARNPLI